jgi:hypothetical protein
MTERADLMRKLRGSVTLVADGREAAAEPALDLKIAVELACAEGLSVAGAMDQRIIDGVDEADRRHIARIRKVAERITDALAAYDAGTPHQRAT